MVMVLDEIAPLRSRVRSAAFGRLLPSVEDSQQTLINLGLREEQLPRDPTADVVGLVCTINGLFASGCGHAGIKCFLRKPDADLGGKAPADVLRQADGVDRIRDLIAREIRRARQP